MDRPTLARALDSAAAQTWTELEIIVVAACGSAHRPLPDSWNGRPLRLVYPQPDGRLSRPDAANLCLESARGEWLNFLDDDDELLPEHLSTLLAPPLTSERVVYSGTRIVSTDGKVLGNSKSESRLVALYFGSISSQCATLIHRSLIDAGARFDPAFVVYEDHDFYIALATQTSFRFVDAVTSVWHASSGNSGCGIGANFDAALRHEQLARIRAKWRPQFAIWLQDADALLFTAEQRLGRNDAVAAAECIRRVLKLRPGDPRALKLAALLAAARANADVLLRVGRQQLDDDQLGAAIASFEKVLALRPGDVNALNLGGVALLRAGELNQAEQWLQQAAQRLPDHPGIAQNLQLLRARRAALTGSQ